MTTELEEPQTLTPVIIPVTELEKINATDAGLAQLKAKASELAAIGTPNKAAYDEVHGLVMVAVKVRTGALTIAKTLATPHKEKYDAIMSEGKRIGEKAKEAEDLLRPLKESYEAEQERIKKEEAEKAAAKIAARHASLSALKAVFDGSSYTVVDVTIDSIEVNALPDEEWNHLYASAELAYQNEQARLAEEQRVREEEAARIAAEQEEQARQQAIIAQQQADERERLRLEQEVFAKQQREFQAEQQRVVQQQAARQAELDRQQKEAEQKRLQEIADRATEQERVAKANRLAERTSKLLELGLFIDEGQFFNKFSDTFLFDEDFLSDISNEEYQDLIQHTIAQSEAVKEAAKAQKAAIAAQNKADKERAKRLAPDKLLLIKHLEAKSKTKFEVLSQPETVDLQIEFEKDLNRLIASYLEKVEAL